MTFSTTRVVDVSLEDENEGKAAFAVHVSQIRVTGLAIYGPFWDFRNWERSEKKNT